MSVRLKPYPRYKDSGVEWLGRIPAQWEIHRIKHVAAVQASNVDKKSEDGELPVNLCNYVDVYYHDRITAGMDFMRATATEAEKRKFQLQIGDVCVTKDSEEWSDIAVPAYVAEDVPDLLCGYHLAVVRPRAGRMNGQFLARAFSARGVNDQFRVEANGITRFALGQDALCNALFPVPPLDEQRAIATFLDRETGKMDALVGKMERLIELLREKRSALISHAVTQGLNPNAPQKDSGIPWLGHIPKHWHVGSLRWFIGIRSGDNISNTEFSTEPSEEQSTPVIGGNGVAGYSRFSNMSQRTLAIGRVGALCGNVHVVQPPAWITDNALMLTTWRNFDLRYLALMLSTMNLNSQASQNAQPLITGGLVKSQTAPMPPVSEQHDIVEHLDRETAKLDALMAKVRTAIERLTEYRTALISAAVTGQIDVRLVSTL